MASATPSFALTYSELPPLFHRAVAADRWRTPHGCCATSACGTARLDVEWLRSADALQALAGNAPLPGASPVAMAYSGHQFGGFNPLLGDGRAQLAGEWLGPDGTRYDLPSQGLGPHHVRPQWRRPRHALGDAARIHRERGLCRARHSDNAFARGGGNGEVVYRQRKERALSSPVWQRDVRVGTFQLAAVNRDRNALEALLTVSWRATFRLHPRDFRRRGISFAAWQRGRRSSSRSGCVWASSTA